MQNSINNFAQTALTGINVGPLSFPSAFVSGIGAGDTDIFTAPSTNRVAFLGMEVFNTAGTSTTWHVQRKISGTYYRYSNDTSTNTNTIGLTPNCFILEPGESLSIHTSQAGLNVWANLVQMSASAPVHSPLVVLTSGDNTIYTCPANTAAIALSSGSLVPYSSETYGVCNMSGAGVTISLYSVPNGQSTGTGTNITSGAAGTISLANNTVLFNATGAPILTPGDAYVVNSSSSSTIQFGWLSVMEIPQ